MKNTPFVTLTKYISCTFIFLLGVNLCEAADVVLNTFYWSTGQGTAAYNFNVPQARLDNQPGWKPGIQPVPLGIDKALQIAQAWIEKQSWSRQFKDFQRITLKQGACWFYSIDFELDGDGLQPREAIILLDGSFVEPVLKPRHSKS